MSPGLCFQGWVMSQQGVQYATAEGDLRTLSPVLLLSVFAIIPLTGLFILLDYFFSGLSFSRSLPVEGDDAGLLNTIFMLPHVLASFFTFADRDYLVAYAGRLGVSSLAILGVTFLVPLWLGYGAFLLILVLYTAHHQVSQQSGIAALVAKNKPSTHEAWKWLSLVLLIILVFSVSLQGNPDLAFLWQDPFRSYFRYFMALLFAGYIVLSVMTAKASKTRIGVFYIAASSMLIAFNFFLCTFGFYFYILLITRIVHDITAFAFYVTHNVNRDKAEPASMMAAIRKRLPLPEYILTPVLALLVSLALTFLMPASYLLPVSIFLAFFHYYWEGVMWKKGSPHRAFLRF